MLKQDENIAMSMNYAEYIVKKKKDGHSALKKALVILALIIAFGVMTWAVCGGLINTPPLELIVIGIVGIAGFFILSSMNIEYEYIVASAQVEFDTIYGQRKRKESLILSLNDIEKIAPANNANKSYIDNFKAEKVYDFSSSKDSPRKYFMCGTVKNVKTIIYFDAIAKTLDVFKYFRSNILEIDKTIYDM